MTKDKIVQNEDSVFNTLSAINVNGHTEDSPGNGATYLSWPFAWGEVKKRYPSATYKIIKFKDPDTGLKKPYMYDANLGYIVFTEVTIEEQTLSMWLPVLDNKFKTMYKEEYTYTTKFGEKSVAAATMFDINKSLMRCLVKNIGMFGLGLYIYAGEDLPEGMDQPLDGEKKSKKAINKEEKSSTGRRPRRTASEPDKKEETPKKETPKEEASTPPKEKIILEIGENESWKKVVAFITKYKTTHTPAEISKIIRQGYTLSKEVRDEVKKLIESKK